MTHDEIRAYLADSRRPADTLTLDELQGFLFAIVNAPEVIAPSEWLPEVFAGEDAQFATPEEAREVLDGILDLYNAVNDASVEEPPGLPPGCTPRDDVMANFDADAPLSGWARGFSRGYGWLETTWDELLPDDPELDHDLGIILMTLTFFASPALAEGYRKETGATSVPEMAHLIIESLPMAIEGYVAIGLEVADVPDEEEVAMPRRVEPKPGRNEPCPCGSGRKYKKCCGDVH